MKMAIVCDDLIQTGGAEKVFLDVLKKYPDATVYTSIISPLWKKKLDALGVMYHTSFLQKFPFAAKLYRFYSILYLHVIAFESFDFSEFDLVFSMSSRYAHFIFTKPDTKHICYMHSPARMFWSTSTYFSSEIWRLFLPFIHPFLFFVRQADYIAAQRIDSFIANSKVTQKRIKKYYHRDSVILNPSADISKFKTTQKVEDYFLVITRLAPWKRVDIVVKAITQLDLKLKVIGTGPDLSRLKLLAKGNKNIEFLGRAPDSKKYDCLSKCQALIYPQYEDFGIVPLEALSSGRPVIAFKKGGALETLTPRTSTFFDDQTAQSLSAVLKKFDQTEFISQNCINRAKEFDVKNFESGLEKLLSDVYLSGN